MNVIELRQVLIIAKRWDVLIQKIRQCHSKHTLMKNVLQDTANVILYADMIVELEKEINNLIVQLNIDLISDDTTLFERQREEFFSNLMKLISTLRQINSKLKDLLPFRLDIEKLEEELKKKVTRLGDQLLTIASKTDLSQQDSDKFRMYYNHLLSFDRHVRMSDFDVRHMLDMAEEKILDKVIFLSREIAASGSDVAKVAEMLIKMKFFAENLSMFDSKINAEIDEALKAYKIKVHTKAFMQLPIVLEKTDIGSRLIAEHACLAGEDWRRRREKMQKQDDIEYMLKELDGDDIATEVLRTCYHTFRQTYDGLISQHLDSLDKMSDAEPNLDILISEIKVLVGTVVQKHCNTVRWNHSFKKNIPVLLAHIFALWTLKNTQHYNAMRGIEAARAYLLMPHVGQVIAIFRILGIGYNEHDDLMNNLVQIGTGEASAWETKANNLRAFMNTIGPKGGMGAEAIEIGLWHAVKESEMPDSISQVILIGDAPANTESEVRQKRARFGEAYWEKTRFGKPTYYTHELQKLKSKNIPVHAFYLTRHAKDNFKQIANETRGRCERLNIHSLEGAESLTDFVTEEVLRKAAGDQGDAAVELYRKTYKTFTF
ncbi:unnamed protein product [Rotaria sordida]|uniref:Uncharacterized protein n=1 Tax=Rotaria sordida TaxID=392033 RepID=A0A815EAP2_9BILA|nr:unnamed protein product [Rotaria sordida]